MLYRMDGRIAQPNKDFFLANPPRQPKREIGEYVESQGIHVPRRFTTLTEAISSQRPFLIRSEHPQDYAGASGLTISLYVNPDDSLESKEEYQPLEAEDWLIFLGGRRYQEIPTLIARLAVNITDMPQSKVEAGLNHLSSLNISDYCRYRNFDPNAFVPDLSYSYWEGLGGFNRAVIADNVIPDRYFIFTTRFTPTKGIMIPETPGYQIVHQDIVHQDKVVDENTGGLPSEVTADYKSLIEFYELIRRLDRFNPINCPMIEIQTQNNIHYFLQYLRVHDFSQSNFSLDRSKEVGEFETSLVRGATPPEGLDLRFNVRFRPSSFLEDEQAGLEINVNQAFIEAVVPNRQLQVLAVADNNDLLGVGGHLRRSGLFKPKVTAVMLDDEMHQLFGKTYDGYKDVLSHMVHIVSDGRRSYIKII